LVQTYQNGKIYQMTTHYIKRLWIVPNGLKIFQMVIKCSNIFYSKALQILPKMGFLAWKQTIWQPWIRLHNEKSGKYSTEIREREKNLECFVYPDTNFVPYKKSSKGWKANTKWSN
jgi:hypothetical protein